jgi:hypothetical protein
VSFPVAILFSVINVILDIHLVIYQCVLTCTTITKGTTIRCINGQITLIIFCFLLVGLEKV